MVFLGILWICFWSHLVKSIIERSSFGFFALKNDQYFLDAGQGLFMGNKSFLMQMNFEDKSLEIVLNANQDLLAPEFRVTRTFDDLNLEEDDEDVDFDPGAIFTGSIVGGGWFSFTFIDKRDRPQILTSTLVKGDLYLNGTLFSVSPADIVSKDPFHYGIEISKIDDGPEGEDHKNYSCSIPDGNFPSAQGIRLGAKAYTPGNIGCSDNSLRTLYMGIGVDCNFVKLYRTSSLALQRVIQIWNAVDAIYRSELNINLAISEIVLASSTCEPSVEWNRQCASNVSMESRLEMFSNWRVSKPGDGIGLWHLITACSSGDTVGTTWLNQICQTTADSSLNSGSTVTGTGVSMGNLQSSISIIAHEIAHSFGAIHDCTDDCTCSESSGCFDCCYCPSTATKKSTCSCRQEFLMNPTLTNSNPPVLFSECTKRQICAQIYQSTYKCLFEPGSKPTYQGTSVCGNGIKEAGEQCDCGSKCSVTSCCTANCTLKANSFCSPDNDACCGSDCQLAKAGTLCRSKASSCDVEEFCDGKSKTCPTDKFLEDGTLCETRLGYTCINGKCTSRDQQCKVYAKVWGLALTSSSCSTDESCLMSCKIGQNCVETPSKFIDGTACGSDQSGKCISGKCDIKHWFFRWGWIIAAAIGGIIVITIITDCIWKRAKKKRQNYQTSNPYESDIAL